MSASVYGCMSGVTYTPMHASTHTLLRGEESLC